MSEAKFTKGPWKWATSNSVKRLLGAVDGKHSMSVVVPYITLGGFADVDIREADMKLIEAAPDMYEALKDCIEALEHVESIGLRVNPPTLANAKAALAKATP